MASLRARLTAVVVLVAAVALIAAAAITYAAQRSYQYDQVDQRVEAAKPLVERELLGDGAFDRGPGGGGPPPGEINLPSGTYGEHRERVGRAHRRAVRRRATRARRRPRRTCRSRCR